MAVFIDLRFVMVSSLSFFRGCGGSYNHQNDSFLEEDSSLRSNTEFGNGAIRFAS
jgi:hypothetical protein